MRRRVVHLAALVMASLGLATTSSAYYYYTFFPTSNLGSPIYARFDVDRLPNNTVPFFISDQGPSGFAQGDSFPAIISEIRSAADVWNGVSTSSIRLGYGGLFTAGTNESAPGVDIEFSTDIPPGLLAMGAPTNFASLPVSSPNGQFVPILRSKLYLPSDLSQVPAAYGAFPSYGEQFFVMLVHEFGHTLGLQHTLTSSVMSTLYTSASTKATPLGADDIAGISLLYPAQNYRSSVGTISGRVTLNGNGVNLASVVAISASNPAISTLTNPDGSYQINGIPPGQYNVYVHPLPPAAYGESSPDNIVFPKDRNGNPINNNPVFATQFYNASSSGTRDASQARAVPVSAGNNSSGINFGVSSRSFVPVYAVRTYGFSQTQVAETSPPLTIGVPATVVATGAGLLQDSSTVAPGLNVGMLGSAAQIYNLRQPYPAPSSYLAFDVMVGFTAGPGAKHLLFNTSNDLYVLPAGFTVGNGPAPSITDVRASAGSVTVSGQNFASDTRILFDGIVGAIQGMTSDGKIIVTPPVAPGGYTATVVALNSDGQSSLLVQPTPMTYTYDGAASPSLTVTPTFLPSYTDTTVDVVGVNTNFEQGQTWVGFATSDVVVKQVNVLSPTHVQVLVTPTVSVAPNGISVTTGIQVLSQALGTQITITNPQASQVAKH